MLAKASRKYRLAILLMADAGGRVLETVRLKSADLDFQKRLVTFNAGSEIRSRQIPMTDRLFDAAIDYWTHRDTKAKSEYLFAPAESNHRPYLSRKMINRQVERLSSGQTTPSALRAYYIYQVCQANEDLLIIFQLTGLNKPDLIYKYKELQHTQLHNALELTEPKVGLLQKVIRQFQSPRTVPIIPMQVGMTKFHIGRKAEIAQITELSQKKVNILLLGPMGIGKSHLLDNYKSGTNSNIIRLDDFRQPKSVMTGLLLALFNDDKQAIMEVLKKVNNESDLEKVATKHSARRLCQVAIQATPHKGYTILIDDLTNITKIGVEIVEKLKNHFHIIAAARYLKIEYANCVSNFEKLELPPLNRPETLEFIDQLSEPLEARIEDYQLFQNHIWEETQGNPLYILELIERLDKEHILSNDIVRGIKHAISRQEIDFSVPLIIAFSSLLVLRYLGNELGSNAGAFRLLGGIALVIAFFSRRIFRALRRRYV